MTLADITALLSRVGKSRPELMQSRDAQLLIEAIIEEGRKLPAEKVPRTPLGQITREIDAWPGFGVHIPFMLCYDTLSSLIEGNMTLTAHCNGQDCRHSAVLDLVGLAERLGPGFVTVGNPNPLVRLLRCEKCQGKDLGLILSPTTGYERTPSHGPLYGDGEDSPPPVKARRARRRVRL